MVKFGCNYIIYIVTSSHNKYVKTILQNDLRNIYIIYIIYI